MLRGTLAVVLLVGCGRRAGDAAGDGGASFRAPSSQNVAVASATSTAKPSGGATSAAPYTCNVEKSAFCYTLKVVPVLLPGQRNGCELSGGVWSEGESCSEERIEATCRVKMFDEVRRFYPSKKLKMKDRETSCKAFGGEWELAAQ